MVLQDCFGAKIINTFLTFFFPGDESGGAVCVESGPILQFVRQHKLLCTCLLLFLASQIALIVLETSRSGGDIGESLEKSVNSAKKMLEIAYAFANKSRRGKEDPPSIQSE